jgi:hypothetical protein
VFAKVGFESFKAVFHVGLLSAGRKQKADRSLKHFRRLQPALASLPYPLLLTWTPMSERVKWMTMCESVLPDAHYSTIFLE